MTKVKMQKWGNSQGIRISKDILKSIGVTQSEHVQFELNIVDNTIVLTPETQMSPYERLFIGYDFNQPKANFEWNGPVGYEV